MELVWGPCAAACCISWTSRGGPPSSSSSKEPNSQIPKPETLKCSSELGPAQSFRYTILLKPGRIALAGDHGLLVIGGPFMIQYLVNNLQLLEMPVMAVVTTDLESRLFKVRKLSALIFGLILLGVGLQVVAHDFGTKHNILCRLAPDGYKFIVVAAHYPADKVIGLILIGIYCRNVPVSMPSALCCDI